MSVWGGFEVEGLGFNIEGGFEVEGLGFNIEALYKQNMVLNGFLLLRTRKRAP